MKKLGRLAVFLLFLGCSSAFAQEAGATFSSMKGQVEVRPDANKKGWRLAKLQTMLQVMDHVKTFEEASAILSFSDMSTFILKPETEIILETPPERETKLQLIAGKIWVNVKKIAKDGTMEIDTNQAVCGIKGTNITCGSIFGEDRIQVLRGVAEVAVRVTGARFTLQSGEELIIRAGGRTEKNKIDVKTESEKWKNELSLLGSSFNLNEVPDLLRNMQQREAAAFIVLAEEFKVLTNETSPPGYEVQKFHKEVERFQGTLMEDSFILNSLYSRIAASIAGNPRSPGAGQLQMILSVSNGLQAYGAETTRFLKMIGSQRENTEAQGIWLEISQIWSEVQEFCTGKPAETGLSQEYFKNVVNRLNKALQKISEKTGQLEIAISRNPTDLVTKGFLKSTNDFQKAIGRAIKNYTVVEIPQAALREMQQADDEIREIMLYLHKQVEAYNLAARNNQNARLVNSVAIVSHFSRARRQYLNCVRLYNSLMRSVREIVTSEQRLFKETFEHLTNTYRDLGSVADQIQNRLEDLERQIQQGIK